jgi:transposase
MSSGQNRKSYTPEYNAEAVRLVTQSSRPVAVVARELGLLGQTLGNWVRAAERASSRPEPGEDVAEEKGVAQLQHELREVRLENEFLKGAAAYFAKTPR